MDEKITYRRATIVDIDFIVEELIEAERSGSGMVSHQKIFHLSMPEYEKLLYNILQEEVPGSEYYCDNYLLICQGEKIIGGHAAWIEGEGNKSSNMIKGALLAYYLGIEKWKEITEDLRIISEIETPREPGALIMEAGYLKQGVRGRNILQEFIDYTINMFKEEYPELKKAQLVCFLENERSIKAVSKAGFTIKTKNVSNNPRIKELIPGKGIVQLEREL